MRCGETRENPVFDWMNLIRAKKGHTIVMHVFKEIDLSTARPKWRLDGPALSVHLLYSLVNHAYANRYHRHLIR